MRPMPSIDLPRVGATVPLRPPTPTDGGPGPVRGFDATPPRAGQLEVRAMDVRHCVASWRNLLIVVWGQETTLQAVENATRLGIEFGRGVAEGGGLLTIVEEEARLPSTEVRAALSKLLRDLAGWVRCSAVVQEGRGFRAATLRAVVTGLTQLARQPYPHRIFDTTATASNWLCNAMPVASSAPVDRDDLCRVVDELRATFDAVRRTSR